MIAFFPLKGGMIGVSCGHIALSQSLVWEWVLSHEPSTFYQPCYILTIKLGGLKGKKYLSLPSTWRWGSPSTYIFGLKDSDFKLYPSKSCKSVFFWMKNRKIKTGDSKTCVFLPSHPKVVRVREALKGPRQVPSSLTGHGGAEAGLKRWGWISVRAFGTWRIFPVDVSGYHG